MRTQKGVSQGVLATQSRLKRPSIVLIEQGRQKVPIDRLFRIAIALNCKSVAELLPDLDEISKHGGIDASPTLAFDSSSQELIDENPEIANALRDVIANTVKKRKTKYK